VIVLAIPETKSKVEGAGDAIDFQYVDDWLASAPWQRSDPRTPGGTGEGRGYDAYSLLAAVGRDCVGALQFLPEGEDPGRAGGIARSMLQ
jgi:hypothetical protein